MNELINRVYLNGSSAVKKFSTWKQDQRSYRYDSTYNGYGQKMA